MFVLLLFIGYVSVQAGGIDRINIERGSQSRAPIGFWLMQALGRRAGFSVRETVCVE